MFNFGQINLALTTAYNHIFIIAIENRLFFNMSKMLDSVKMKQLILSDIRYSSRPLYL